MKDGNFRVIKIGADALFEFIYESFIDEQGRIFNVKPVDVSDYFYFDRETNNFIFCVSNTYDKNGDVQRLSDGVDLSVLVNKVPDTTESMYSGKKKYREYSKKQLLELQKEED